MIRIESERSEGGKTTHHARYFISSTSMKTKDFLDAIRQHWSIENGLHWVLDVAFRADDARLRAENAAKNFVVLKHMALNLLQNVKGSKVGINIHRFEAACIDRFLLNILASCPDSMRLPCGGVSSATSGWSHLHESKFSVVSLAARCRVDAARKSRRANVEHA